MWVESFKGLLSDTRPSKVPLGFSHQMTSDRARVYLRRPGRMWVAYCKACSMTFPKSAKDGFMGTVHAKEAILVDTGVYYTSLFIDSQGAMRNVLQWPHFISSFYLYPRSCTTWIGRTLEGCPSLALTSLKKCMSFLCGVVMSIM